MLHWIMKKLRVSTPKSTPSSEAAEKTSPEPSVSSIEWTVPEALQIVNRAPPVIALSETPASAGAIILQDNWERDLAETWLDNRRDLIIEDLLKIPLSEWTKINAFISNYSTEYLGYYTSVQGDELNTIFIGQYCIWSNGEKMQLLIEGLKALDK